MDEEEPQTSSAANFLGHDSVDNFIKDVMVSVQSCRKLATELQGWQHYKDYAGMEPAMNRANHRLVSIIENIFTHSDVKLKLRGHKLGDQFDMIREGNDSLLDRTNSTLDEAAGLKKQPALNFVNTELKTVKSRVDRNGRQVVLMAARNTQKPQLFFKEKVNNSAKEPFVPLLKEKPNSLKPLAMLISLDEQGREFFDHPYKYELDLWKPSEEQLQIGPVHNPRNLDDTPLIRVETTEALQQMVDNLKTCTEFAVDLEHHNFRSYLGLTCLMQISTRKEDYIVDTLALRGNLCVLNEVFTDTKIIKVFHGADSDINWLQRDCGVYVVNLFDTHQAAVVLEYPQKSLAALLQHFCSIQANKVYQRADWRTRPIPPDFLEYARQDTHYLLYIFDMLRNELIQKGNDLNNLLETVYRRSNELCMTRYEKPIVDEDSYLPMYRSCRKTFNNRQVFALQKIYLWRDSVARDHDESVDFVLPKHMMLQIAEVLPKEMQGILACCNPIPPLVKTELLTLHNLIRKAREQPLSKTDARPNPGYTMELENNDDTASTLISKHDLSQIEENATGLPCLLKEEETLLGDLFSENVNIETKNHSQLFGSVKNNLKIKDHKLLKTNNFMSPYERHVSFIELKPLLEGDLKKKLQIGDISRLSRVKDHISSLLQGTANLDTTEESTPIDSDKAERINGLFKFLQSIQTTKSQTDETDSKDQSDGESPPAPVLPLTEEEGKAQMKAEKANRKTIRKREKANTGVVLNTSIKKLKKQKKKLLKELKESQTDKEMEITNETVGKTENETINAITDTNKTNKKKKKQELDEVPNSLEILDSKNQQYYSEDINDDTENVNITGTDNKRKSTDDMETPKPKKKKKKKKNTANSTINEQETVTVQRIDDLLSALKRKSSEFESDNTQENPNKKTKQSSENKNVLSEDNSNSTADEEIDSSENQVTESCEGENSEAKVEFDYNAADYSVFENKKEKKKQQNYKQKFKTVSQKSKMLKKGGMKCLTWGGKKKR